MEMGLVVHIENSGKDRILRLEGRVDAASSAILEKKMLDLIQDKHVTFAMDFSKVDYLSSAGIRLFLSMMKKLHHQGGKMVFFSVGEDVMEVIKLAGFDKILNIFSNEEEAIQALR